MSGRAPGRGAFRAIGGQGFPLAVVYALFGLALELLYGRLPPAVYERAAAAVYGLPIRLLASLDLQSVLIAAVAQGRVPAWLAGAAVPALGVALILAAATILGAGARFAALVLSLRQR